MLELIYASSAVRPFSEADLSTLLMRARANNQALGVSGMLLYDKGSFLQVLEGEAPVVRTLFARIGRDERHTRVVVLLESFVEQRGFADWKMGFVSVDRLRAAGTPGFDDFLDASVSRSTLAAAASTPSKARAILLGFRSGRWRTYVES